MCRGQAVGAAPCLAQVLCAASLCSFSQLTDLHVWVGGTASSRGTGRLQGDSPRSKIPSELHLGTRESCCPAVCIPCKHLTATRRAKTHHHHPHSVVGTAHAESRGGPSSSWKLAGDVPALCRSSGLQPRGSALGLGAGWLPAPLCSCVHRERSAGSSGL